MADETPVTDADLERWSAEYEALGAPCEHRAAKACYGCDQDRCAAFCDSNAVPRLIAEVRRYQEAMAALRAEHKPFRIYTECNHSDEDHERLGIESFDMSEGDFVTCEDGFEYEICSLCCEYCGGQGEVCGTSHDHDKDNPICPTRAILDASMKGEEPAS